MKLRCGVGLCLALLLIVLCCGCTKVEEEPKNVANFANTVMGGFAFAYRDGFIYFMNTDGYVYEYDIENAKTARLGQINGFSAEYPIVTEEKLIYVSSDMESDGVYYITRDGKESGMLFKRDDFGAPYLEGNTWYFRASRWDEEQQKTISQIWSRDKETGAETLLFEEERINATYIDKDYIYAVVIDSRGEVDENKYDYLLLRSPKDKINFERVVMPLKPIKVFADGEDLYISQMGTWQIYHYAKGEATPLPVTAFNYQVLDNHLIYLVGSPGKVQPFGDPLMLYNIETGKEEQIAKSAFFFAVLNNRYVAYGVNLDGYNFRWYVYDWQTGETKEMVKPV